MVVEAHIVNRLKTSTNDIGQFYLHAKYGNMEENITFGWVWSGDKVVIMTCPTSKIKIIQTKNELDKLIEDYIKEYENIGYQIDLDVKIELSGETPRLPVVKVREWVIV